MPAILEDSSILCWSKCESKKQVLWATDPDSSSSSSSGWKNRGLLYELAMGRSIRNAIHGRIFKADCWRSFLIDRLAIAQRAGYLAIRVPIPKVGGLAEPQPRDETGTEFRSPATLSFSLRRH